MITDLRFFKERPELAGPDGYQISRSRAADRTTAVIRKYIDVNAALKDARQATISHCEAVEGKGGVVSLRVADRPGFEALQSQIKAKSEDLAALEQAIKALDGMGPDTWFTDIEDQVGSYGRVEAGENSRLSHLASSVLSRKMYQGKPADQLLAEDEEYMRLSAIAKEQIDNANRQLETLRPKLEAMRASLEAVGC